MTPDSTPDNGPSSKAVSVEALSRDDLFALGKTLGLELEDKVGRAELVQRVSRRRRLLDELDRDALLDVVKWARRPVRDGASRETLASEIAQIDKTAYEGLSRRGLRTLARLRDLKASESDNTEAIIERLHKADGFWKRLHRKRRSLIGSWLAKIVDDGTAAGDEPGPPEGGTQFAGGSDAVDDPSASLKRDIEDRGIVGGLANRLRGAADEYIKVKLDEIEQRIDDKLNEIDQRLAEWRDREIANRLKILRITLAFTVVVALLSLGYNFFKRPSDAFEQPVAKTTATQPAPHAAAEPHGG